MSTLADILKTKQPDVYRALAILAGHYAASWHRGHVVSFKARRHDQETPVEGELKAAL